MGETIVALCCSTLHCYSAKRKAYIGPILVIPKLLRYLANAAEFFSSVCGKGLRNKRDVAIFREDLIRGLPVCRKHAKPLSTCVLHLAPGVFLNVQQWLMFPPLPQILASVAGFFSSAFR